MIVQQAHKDPVFTAYQNVHRAGAQASCQQPVEGGGSPSALHVTEDRGTQLET